MTYGNGGYSFPAAMGAKIACPDKPSFAFAGDGAWGMSLNEVLTCVREDIPTTAVVFNNGQWGAEKKNQVLWFGDRYIGTQLKGDHSYVVFENFDHVLTRHFTLKNYEYPSYYALLSSNVTKYQLALRSNTGTLRSQKTWVLRVFV